MNPEITDETLREHIIAWLIANDIDPKVIPDANPGMSLVGNQLTANVYLTTSAGRIQMFPGNEMTTIARIFAITVMPPPDVAAWLAPRCPTCGR